MSFFSANVPAILSTPVNIDAKSVGGTTIYTVPSGKTAYITGCNVRCTTATAITTGPSCGVGTSVGTDDIFASVGIALLTTISKLFSFSSFGMGIAAAAGTAIIFNVDVAAIGTLQTITPDLIGYLI
jgi:hypothetical protein